MQDAAPTAKLALQAAPAAGTTWAAFGAMSAAVPVEAMSAVEVHIAAVPVEAMYAGVPVQIAGAPVVHIAAVPVQVPVQDILNDPSKWPASFARPVVATRVLTYVFDQKDDSKVEEFLKFIKENFPDALLSVVKDNAGFTTTTITEVGDATAAAGCAGWIGNSC